MTTALREKLKILSDAAKYDASCASSGSKRKQVKEGIGNTEGMGICHSYTPDGRCVSLLKILLTNVCIYDCAYCINRVSSDIKRAKFTPDEVVYLTLEFYKRNYIEGLFLSSGVYKSPDATMEQMIEVAKSLRVDHKFGGYIHLKMVAGCSSELTRKAGLYADRLSANIELPKQADLDLLAPEKNHAQVEQVMTSIASGIDEAKSAVIDGSKQIFVPGGQSTQMIVGATPSSDADILQRADALYKTHKLRRVYYSAFSPIVSPDTRLPMQAPPMVREHRLYQADWLLRFYGYKVDEIVPDDAPQLDISKDPKLMWALRNREFFPVNINTATRYQLLRIPGVGVRNVDRILQIRRHQKIRLHDLRKLRVQMNKAKFFITTGEERTLFDLANRNIDTEGLPNLVEPKDKDLVFEEASNQAFTGEL